MDSLTGQRLIMHIINEYVDGDYLVREYSNGARERFLNIPVEPEPEQPVRILTKLQFRNRFTMDEKAALYTAAESNAMLRIFLDDLNAAENIDLDDPATVGAVNALEHLGIIGSGRAAEILENVDE